MFLEIGLEEIELAGKGIRHSHTASLVPSVVEGRMG
jgi:hypothetical protein